MVHDYLITLRKPDFKVVDIISQLLYLVAFATFVFFAAQSQVFINLYSLSALVLLVIFIFLRIKLSRKQAVYFTPGFAIAAITFFIGWHSNWVLALFYVVCLLAEREYKFHKEVGFSTNAIVFNTLIKKFADWSELNNVIIKDGLLTIDFKNNKVYQKEIEGEVSGDIETEFNAFCKEQLNKTSVIPTTGETPAAS